MSWDKCWVDSDDYWNFWLSKKNSYWALVCGSLFEISKCAMTLLVLLIHVPRNGARHLFIFRLIFGSMRLRRAKIFTKSAEFEQKYMFCYNWFTTGFDYPRCKVFLVNSNILKYNNVGAIVCDFFMLVSDKMFIGWCRC